MDPDTSTPQKSLSTFTPQSDSSKYIRTYAKDMAQVTNTPAPAVSAAVPSASPASPVSPEASKLGMVHEMGVSLPEVDESPMNRKGEAVSPKEFDGEHLELTQADSEGIFKGKSDHAEVKAAAAIQQSASPLMPQESIGVKPVIAPTEQVSQPAEAPAAEENREAILTRLRAKLSTYTKEKEEDAAHEGRIIEETILPKPEEVQVVAPVQPPAEKMPPATPAPEPVPEPTPKPSPEPPANLPKPMPAPAPTYREPIPPLGSLSTSSSDTGGFPLRTGAPTFSSARESMPTPPHPAPAPKIQPEIPVAPPPVSAPMREPSPLHTYSSDFADRIDREKSSTFSVLAAQSDAGQTPRPVSAPRRTLVPLLAGGAMLVIGVGAVLGAYTFMHQRQEVPIVAGVPSLIRYDESVEVKGVGTMLMNAIADVAAGGSVSGNVIVTYVTTDADGAPTGIPQPGGVLIRALSLPAPSILLRNIEDSSTVGVIDAGGETRPFLILKVSSYERTFAGMLAWEQTLPADLNNFYPEYSALPQEVASSSASSTLPASLSYTQTGAFTDYVVANHDVRVLRDAAGRSLLLYGYVSSDILVIARDETAFAALASRISASGD